VQETDLAWALAEVAERHLSLVERNDLYIAIGVGDTFAAVRNLITSAAAKRIALPADLVERCASWLDAYVGHEDERCLRGLIEHVLTRHAIHSDNRIDETICQANFREPIG
jgi:hypothetical protein